MANIALNKEKVYGIIGKELTVDDFKKYQLSGFNTSQSDLLKYNGKPFNIIRSLTSREIDLTVAPMFKIIFEDGFQTDAYMDEIFKEKIFDELIHDENLVRH